MEENELEEVVEETTVEVPEEGASEEDFKEYWEKKTKTLEAQKAHWKGKYEKATQATPQKEPELKTNNEYLTREEAVLLAKGYDEEDLNRLNLLAKADGKKLTEVVNDEMFVAWKEKKDDKVKAVKAQLGSSKSSTSKSSKSVSEMTPEEHKAYWQSLQ